MAYDITAALDLLDLAVGRATEIVEPELLTPHAQAAKDIRARIGFLGRSVVVALVGGTGSGKSSLLNALAGEEIAATGVVRPTTERPLAWIPANAEPGLIRLLDDLAIGDRIGHDSFGDIAILDLPDTDSVVRSHREVVEYLLPRVDAVIWVLDPEKYNDRLLHRDLLQPLSRYSKQFIFVLNQIDRLSPAEENQVVDDLRRTLALDGIENAQLLATAADPDEGPPIGIARLSRDLHGRLEAKQVVMTKLIADLREARDGIARSTGVGVGAGTSYDDRWDATANRVAGILVDPVLADDASAREAGRQALEDRVVLAVDGENTGAVRAGCRHHEMPAHDQGLLVREGDVLAGGERREGGTQRNRAGGGDEDNVRFRQGGEAFEPRDAIAGKQGRFPHPEFGCDPIQVPGLPAGGHAHQFEAVGMFPHHLEGAFADGPRGPEQDDAPAVRHAGRSVRAVPVAQRPEGISKGQEPVSPFGVPPSGGASFRGAG